jgi:hypothetical protein
VYRLVQASYNRRTATKVKDGRVQRKNRHVPTVHSGYVFDRESPGRGFRHVVSRRDVQAFMDMVSDWDRISHRLERVVLAAKDSGLDGQYAFYHREESGAIFLHAWNEDLWVELKHEYFDAHRKIFEKLGVSFDCRDREVFCRFTAPQARALMLLHVFMHELGHHYAYTRQKHRSSTKGEDFAEIFATSRFNQLLPEYVRVFGDPAKAGVNR